MDREVAVLDGGITDALVSAGTKVERGAVGENACVTATIGARRRMGSGNFMAVDLEE
jgi:hypothetical protein